MISKFIKEMIDNNEKRNKYMFLSRFQMDLNYYFGNGARNPKTLWALDFDTHIENMKALHNSFSDSEKPQWLSYEEIEEYERKNTEEVVEYVNGYKIDYNPLFDEYIVTHDEIGYVESFNTIEEATKFCRKG